MTRARDNATQGGLVLLNKTDFTTASSVAVDNVFTSTYQNYKMLLNITAVSGSYVDISWYGRKNGSDITTNYNYQMIYARSTSLASESGSTGRLSNAATGGGYTSQQEILICNPQIAQYTIIHTSYQSEQSAGAPYLFVNSTRNVSTEQFDGIKLYPSSGTMSGTFRIYGIKN